MMGKRDYFPMFFRYRESFTGLTDEQVGRIILAAIDYAADGKTPRLPPVENMAFAFIRGDIDRAVQAYEERCEKNRQNVQKRWEAEGDTSYTSEYERIQANTNDTKQTNNQTNKQSNNIPSGGDTRARTRGNGKQSGKRLTVGGPDAAEGATHRDEPVPPTVDDINAYCREAGLVHVDPQRFYDHYSTTGWMLNGKPMRDWKARCRIWDAEDAEKAAHAAPKPQETSFDTDEFFEAALARSYADYNGEGGWTDES